MNHPDLRWRIGDGRVAVWLDDFENPIGRAERLNDGAWRVSVRPLRNKPEVSAVISSEAEALGRLTAWARKHAWTYRPNVHSGRLLASSLKSRGPLPHR